MSVLYYKVYLSSSIYGANRRNPQSLKREYTTKTYDLHVSTNCITQCVCRYFHLKIDVVLLYDHFRHFCVHLNFRNLTLDVIYVQKFTQKNVVKSNHPHITYTLFTGKRLLTTHEAKLKVVVTRMLPRDQEQLKGRITASTFFFILFSYKVCLPSLPSSLSLFACLFVPCKNLKAKYLSPLSPPPLHQHLLVTEMT